MISNDFTLLDGIPDTQSEALDVAKLRNAEWQALDQVIAQLDEREQRVLRGYYGLAGGESQILEQIGVKLDITCERIRQIRNQALAKLRKIGYKPL